jgi:heme/copper-type cytochrome/quinol oxidase subunit 1
MLQSIFTSIVRTMVPYIIGGLVSFLTTLGVQAELEFVAGLTSLLTLVFGTIYYIAARFVETKYPDLGWLLGVPVQPKYVDKR